MRSCFFYVLLGLACAAAQIEVCGNGILVVDEECDDGNVRDGDGCSSECLYEDPCGCAAGDAFQCNVVKDTATGNLLTHCCVTRTNPVTGAHVCDCVGQASSVQGTWVTDTCDLLDVDECRVGNGGCSANARCVNLDARGGGPGMRCECDFYGDGVERCDLVRYTVSVVLSVRNASEGVVNTTWLDEQAPLSLAAVYDPEDGVAVLGVASERLGAQGGRRLLSTYDHYTLVFEVGTWDHMQALTTDLNAALLAAHLENATLGLNRIEVLQSSTASVEEAPVEYTLAELTAPGFLVTNFSYELVGGAYLWDIFADFFAPPGMSYAFFASKGHGGEAAEAHECVVSPDVCCLWRMNQNHYLGAFETELVDVIVPWCDDNRAFNGSNVSSASILSGLSKRDWPLGAFDSMVGSEVTVPSLPLTEQDAAGEAVQLRARIAQNDVVANLAESVELQNATQYTFALGMVFWRGLSVSDMYVAVGQTKLQVLASNSLTFAVSSLQEYSYLTFLDASLYELQYWPSSNVAHRLQYVRVVVVVPGEINGVGVPPTSLQIVRAGNISAVQGATWTNPCWSAMGEGQRDGSGLWDFANGTRALYETASGQSCAMRDLHFCSSRNQTSAGDTLLTIDVPLGGELMTGAALEAGESLFLRLLVEGMRDGDEIMTQVATQLRAEPQTLLRMCEPALSSLLKDTDFVSVSLSVGLSLEPIGADQRDAVVFNDITRAPRYGEIGALDISETYQAVSQLDSVLTLSLEGTFNFFNADRHDAFSVEIDHALMVHVRNDAKHAVLSGMIANATAFTQRMVGGYSEIELSGGFASVCAEATSDDCVVTHPIYRRNATTSAHVLTSDIDGDVVWLLDTFGDTPSMRELAAEFAADARVQFGFNWRYRRGWWVVPTYPWPVSTVGLVDRSLLLVTFAVDRNLA